MNKLIIFTLFGLSLFYRTPWPAVAALVLMFVYVLICVKGANIKLERSIQEALEKADRE